MTGLLSDTSPRILPGFGPYESIEEYPQPGGGVLRYGVTQGGLRSDLLPDGGGPAAAQQAPQQAEPQAAPPSEAPPSDLAATLGGWFLPNQAEAAGPAEAADPGSGMITVDSGKGHKVQFPAGTSPDEIRKAMAKLAGGPALTQATTEPDRKTGAPAHVREMVGGAPPPDRLAQIRQFYPDAEPAKGDDGNFVFTDPGTGRPTLYNPPGLDYGDIPSIGRDLVSAVGAGVGAAGAAVAAPFTGGAGLLAVPVGAGAGATLGGAAYDALRMARGGVDTRGPIQRTADAASEFGTNSIFQGGADRLPGMVRDFANSGASRLTGKTAPELWDAFKRLNILPTAGQITGNRAFQGTENAASKMPTGAQHMGNFATQQADALGQRVEQLATDYGTRRGATPGVSPTEAGRSLQRGGQEFVTNFQNTTEKLFDDLYNTMPRDTPASASNIIGTLQRQSAELAAAPNLAAKLENPTLRGYLDAIQADISPQGTLPYNVISSFRSKIGRMISDPMTVADIPRAELKQVYAALSADMEAAAAAAGPDALKRFQGANRYYAAGLKRIEAVIDKVMQSDTPEKAFRWAMEGSQAKGGGGTRLMQLRRSMPAEEWDVASSFVLRQMGEAVPSQQGSKLIFSPETFLTRWNQIAPDARAALFNGTKYDGLPARMQDLLDVAATMRDTKYMANASGTAGQSMFMAFLQPFGVGAGAGTAAGMSAEGATLGALAGAGNAVLPHVAARAMTNQKFVKWLTELGATTNPNSLTAHMARLTAIMAADPWVKEFAQSVWNGMRPAPEPVRHSDQPPVGR